MKKIFHLAACSTNQRILKELEPYTSEFEFKEIKSQKMTAKELSEMKKRAGSYEALFSRVALKFRSMGLNNMQLTEEDYKKYILEEYTFLKRPVIIHGDAIFIGNAKSTVAAAKANLSGE
jgi:arsenate reductase